MNRFHLLFLNLRNNATAHHTADALETHFVSLRSHNILKIAHFYIWLSYGFTVAISS